MKNALLLTLVYSTVVTVFLIAYFGSISGFLKKISKDLNFSQRFILILAVCVILAVVLGFVLLVIFKVNISTNLGQVGDFIGGILNPILSFLALIAIVISISLQEKELSSSVESLKSQEQIFKTQNFESSFFNLLSMYRSRRTEQLLNAEGGPRNAYEVILEKMHQKRRVIEDAHGFGREAHKAAKEFMEKYMSYDSAYLLVTQFDSIVKFVYSAKFDTKKNSYYIGLAYSDFSVYEAAVLVNYSLTNRAIRYDLKSFVFVTLRDEYYLSPLLARSFNAKS